MIDPENIVQLLSTADPTDPPSVSVTLHLFKIIQRIAPELSVFAEIVRRNTGYFDRHVFFIQKKVFR